MNARLSLRAALLALALVAPLTAITPPGMSSSAASGSLRTSPGAGYVGGQAMNFAGNIGSAGARKIWLQSNMNRPGEGWSQVEGFRGASTQADGSFDFDFLAPSMFGIRYRVVSGPLTTSPVTFDAQSQDLTLAPVTQPVAGRAFDIEVDTTPFLVRRPDTKELQPFPGRPLTLQRRLDDGSWVQVGSTTQVGQNGMGYFRGLTVDGSGTVVYRAIQGDWNEGGNKIGWFPSFPTYVVVRDPAGTTALPGPVNRAVVETQPAALPRSRDVTSIPAAKRYSWGRSYFDFAWVFGESLTSPAYRGAELDGQWLDYTDGGGRANPHNGRLILDSKRDNDAGPGDFGTTRATLSGIPMTYGRWETRLRVLSEESNAQDYQVLFELVPESPADQACSANTITVARVAAHTNKVTVGVSSANKKWFLTKRNVRINDQVINYAVEVARGHITWFMNGRPIATVKNKAAIPGIPMTMRMSMVGSGQQEMNRTRVASDWERGWTLKRGKQVTSGPALKQSRYSASSAC